jgi:diacylglycerol kinase family enzyme
MHVYIYDSFLSQKKYESVLARIETRTTDLGLNGKIIRLGVMHSLADAVANEIKKGAKTITAVGHNELFHNIVNVFARLARQNVIINNIPLGFIPVGRKGNNLAAFFGVEPEENACNILSARRIEQLDLGQINSQYFLAEARIASRGTKIEIDGDYSIEIMGGGEISVINLPVETNLPSSVKTNGQDGQLELYIRADRPKKLLPLKSRPDNPSVFPFKKIVITNSLNQPVTVDGSAAIPTPAEITLAKEKINIIVGKSRHF